MCTAQAAVPLFTDAATDPNAVIAEIAELLRPACTLPPAELAQVAEAVFLMGARFGLDWSDSSGGRPRLARCAPRAKAGAGFRDLQT